MKLTIKTLSQRTIEIEIDASKTVRDLKMEISKILGGDYSVEKQKLICAGVVMDDAEKISNFNITSDKFIVVMLLRTDQVAEQNSQSSVIATNELVTQIVSDTESSFLTGEDYKQAINIMVEMGFERANVEHAMAASYNNPERAFEYLTNGIPDNIEAATQDAAGSPANPQINAETVNQVLELLRQNPNLLTATLQQMGVTNAQLLQQIQSNPDAFLNLMRQQTEHAAGGGGGGVGATNVSSSSIVPQQLLTSTAAAQPAAVASDSAITAAAMQNFTPADHAAIERLKAMGFQEVMAVQAYVAFDKNESLAANFLASNIDDQN